MLRESHSLPAAAAAMLVREVPSKRGGSQYEHTESTRDDGAGSKLPSELLEQMLPFVPVPDLCRFRTVCKSWNSLICTPDFGTLCMQNGSKGECFLVKLRLYSALTRRSTVIPSWSILDLNAKRWYSIKHELTEGYDYDMPAMDAGLVCTFVNAFTDEERHTSLVRNSNDQGQTLIVFNPLEKRVKALPNPRLGRVDLPYLSLRLVMDNVSQAYKIFLIRVGYFWGYNTHPFMVVYESSINQWRIPPNPLSSRQFHPGKFGDHVRTAVYRGLLYVLYAPASETSRSYGLYSYDSVEDAWEYSGVDFGLGFSVSVDTCDLVVSDNRLFLMTQRFSKERRSVQPRGWGYGLQGRMGSNLLYDMTQRVLEECRQSGQPIGFCYGVNNRRDYFPDPCPLDISEILLDDRRCRTVAQMTEAEVFQSFDVQPIDRSTLRIQAYGFDKSILLMSKKVHGETGKYVLYNLELDSWEFLPPNPVECLHYPKGYHGSLMRFGKQMSHLRLPKTPWD